MPQRTRSQTQLASSLTSSPVSSPEAPRRPRKEKVMELSKIDAAWMNSRQAQLEEAVGVMSQDIGTIKELLERLLVPKSRQQQGVISLLKSDALSSKLLRPPHVVKWPQGIARTRSKSPSLWPNQPSQPYKAARKQILRLDHLGLTTEQR